MSRNGAEHLSWNPGSAALCTGKRPEYGAFRSYFCDFIEQMSKARFCSEAELRLRAETLAVI